MTEGSTTKRSPSDKSRPWAVVASVGSIVVAAVTVSICCVGPLVFALVGISGAGVLFDLEENRPYFVAMTFALLAASFYFTYRNSSAKAPAKSAGSACGCSAPTASRAGKITLWVASILVAVFLSLPYLLPSVFG